MCKVFLQHDSRVHYFSGEERQSRDSSALGFLIHEQLQPVLESRHLGGPPLGLVKWKGASSRGEAGTSGFLSISDSNRSPLHSWERWVRPCLVCRNGPPCNLLNISFFLITRHSGVKWVHFWEQPEEDCLTCHNQRVNSVGNTERRRLFWMNFQFYRNIFICFF